MYLAISGSLVPESIQWSAIRVAHGGLEVWYGQPVLC